MDNVWGPIIPVRFVAFAVSSCGFSFFQGNCAVFRFCRRLRFAEMDVILTPFSALPYICSGFSVLEKYAVC